MQCTDHIGLTINIASHHIRRSLDAMTSKVGLSGLQGRILGELYRASCTGQEVYQKDIERKFGIRRSSVTSVISNLEDNGYLLRSSVSSDARLKKLELTEKGRQTQLDFCRFLDTFEASLSAEFTAEEKAQLLSMLDRLIKRLGETDDCPDISVDKERT